jgi:hypothetical protein
MRTSFRLFARVLAGLALVPLLPLNARADPPSGTVPRSSAVIGVGADTTETLFDQLAADYDNQRPHRGGLRFYSFGSRGASPITPKAGCAPIERPSGSSQGVTALLDRQVLRSGRPCVDFVRVIRPRLPSDPPALVFVPFAVDGLTWAANAGGHAPDTLSLAQLTAIFTCQARTWDQVGGQSGGTIQPKLPIVGPGITYFLNQLGVSQLGDCVQTGVPQDEGTDPVIAGNPDALVMYSISTYLSQTVYHHDDRHGSLQLRQIEGRLPTVVNPGDGRTEFNIGQVPGTPGFPSPLWIQESLAMLARDDGSLPHDLVRLFAGPRSWLCTNPRAQADVASFGFLELPQGVCGQQQ